MTRGTTTTATPPKDGNAATIVHIVVCIVCACVLYAQCTHAVCTIRASGKGTVYPMGYWTDLFYGKQLAKHNTNSVDHSLKLSKW